MNRSDTSQDAFDLPDLWTDLQDLEDGSIAPEKREALMELLARSPAARRAYYEYFHQAAVLGIEADKAKEGERLINLFPPSRMRAWWAQPWVGVAAVLTILVVIGVLLIKPSQRPDSIVNPVVTQSLRGTAVDGTLWEMNGVRNTDNAESFEVKAGDSIRVLSGTLKLEFASGTQMIIQGPSSVAFPELRKPFVQEGLLWIDTGATDDDFEVSTSELVVRDIGTRFGVRVDENNFSEIHLHEGGVNVLSRESGIELATLAADGKGQAISADGNLTELPLADDPFPKMHKLLSGGSSYSAAILAQDPISYVKFYGGVEGRYDNEIPGGRTAKSGPSVTMHFIGVNEDERFKGFDMDNKSIYLPANESNAAATSVVAFLDASKGVSQRQGSATFWIKQVQGSKEDQVLWLAGKVDHKKGHPSGALACTYITSTGHVGFSLENRDNNIVLKSDQAINDNGWHHIGVTWGSNAASIYVDGKQVAHRSDVPELDEWVSYGNFVRFGKPTVEQYSKGMQNFHGWLDEFALWNRPLTPEEVSQQYNAAIGAESER